MNQPEKIPYEESLAGLTGQRAVLRQQLKIAKIAGSVDIPKIEKDLAEIESKINAWGEIPGRTYRIM